MFGFYLLKFLFNLYLNRDNRCIWSPTRIFMYCAKCMPHSYITEYCDYGIYTVDNITSYQHFKMYFSQGINWNCKILKDRRYLYPPNFAVNSHQLVQPRKLSNRKRRSHVERSRYVCYHESVLRRVATHSHLTNSKEYCYGIRIGLTYK